MGIPQSYGICRLCFEPVWVHDKYKCIEPDHYYHERCARLIEVSEPVENYDKRVREKQSDSESIY